jgi:predicted RNA-binding Zn-ribbon protein involved in translation (DUF1610 family)
MPKMQKIPGYAARTFLINGVFAVIGLSFFGLIWFAGNHGGGVKLWIGIAGFVGSAIAMMIIQAVRARSFHCPNCGQHIPVRYRDSGPNWDKGRYRVQFVCPRCDIIWDTGLRQ